MATPGGTHSLSRRAFHCLFVWWCLGALHHLRGGAGHLAEQTGTLLACRLLLGLLGGGGRVRGGRGRASLLGVRRLLGAGGRDGPGRGRGRRRAAGGSGTTGLARHCCCFAGWFGFGWMSVWGGLWTGVGVRKRREGLAAEGRRANIWRSSGGRR